MRVVPIIVIAVLGCASWPALAQAPDSNSAPPALAPEAAPPAAAAPAPAQAPEPAAPAQQVEAPPLPPPAAQAPEAAAPAQRADARPPPSPPPSGRFSFKPVDGGLLRLDAQSGQVAFCSARTAGWTCETAAEDRAALETEIGRLQDEVASLKQDLAALREPPPPRPPADLAPQPPPQSDKRDDAAQLREDLERARVAFENAWQRLVDMLVNFQKDVMRKS